MRLVKRFLWTLPTGDFWVIDRPCQNRRGGLVHARSIALASKQPGRRSPLAAIYRCSSIVPIPNQEPIVMLATVDPRFMNPADDT